VIRQAQNSILFILILGTVARIVNACGSKFHSVYINTIDSQHEDVKVSTSKFHSVYINTTFSVFTWSVSGFSKFHSVYINTLDNSMITLYIILSKFHSVYINTVKYVFGGNDLDNSKFHSVYINTANEIRGCKWKFTQNSILFILIRTCVHQRKRNNNLKIPFCLY